MLICSDIHIFCTHNIVLIICSYNLYLCNVFICYKYDRNVKCDEYSGGEFFHQFLYLQ